MMNEQAKSMNETSRVWYVQVGSQFYYYDSEDGARFVWEHALEMGDYPCAIGWKLVDVNAQIREVTGADTEARGEAYANDLDDEWLAQMEWVGRFGYEQ